LKQATAVSLLVLSSLVLMAQTATHRSLEANAFVLVDQNGNHSAELSMRGGVPGLTIFGTGKGNIWLAAGEAGPFLSLEGVEGGLAKGLATLGVTKTGPSLSIGGWFSKGSVSLAVNKAGPSLSLLLEGTDGGLGEMSSLDANGLLVEDSQGFRSVLGVTKTVRTTTGEQRKSYAAALTMFGKDNKVIWSAP